MSGIEIDPDIVTLFNDMKLRSIHKWATFKIEKKKKIILDETGEACSTESKDEDKKWFDGLKGKLSKEPRYILYDFGFTLEKDGRILKKLAFIFWWGFHHSLLSAARLYFHPAVIAAQDKCLFSR